MARIATCRIVAAVKNPHPIWDRALREFIGSAVCLRESVPVPDRAITGVVFRTNKWPTLICLSDQYFRPESFREREDASIYRHRGPSHSTAPDQRLTMTVLFICVSLRPSARQRQHARSPGLLLRFLHPRLQRPHRGEIQRLLGFETLNLLHVVRAVE